MKGKTKFVAFSAQKGGVGKTTFMVLAAFYLHYAKGFNIAATDCDYPQYPIVEMRRRDLKLTLEDEHYKRLVCEQFTRLQKKAYPVMESSTREALVDAGYLLPQGDFDYVFLDLLGTINNEDLIYSLVGMDYLVTLINAGRAVMEGTLNYAVVVKEHVMDREKSRMKGLYMLWDMVDGRGRTGSCQVYEAVTKELGLPVLKTFLPDTKRLCREQNASRHPILRLTLFPADCSLTRGNNLDKLMDESIELLKQDLMNGKEHDDGLDTSFIISQVKSRSRPLHPYTPEKEEEASALSGPSGEAVASPAMKEEGRRRRGKGQDYERLSIRNAPSNTRGGRTVYIRKEFHERIIRIVQAIGKDELSLYSYLDNMLKQHFATYQEEISGFYKEWNSDIFQLRTQYL